MSETPEQRMKHLDEMTCLLYIERQLDRARGLQVSAHTQECDACRTLLRALERETRLLTRAMLEEDEPLPSRLAQFQERAQRSMQWIWGLVFGLAATGVYALYTGYIQPWQQQLEQAGFGGSSLLSLLIFQGAMWKGWQSMITLLEVLAMLTLGVLGAMFFRRRIRRGSALALVFAGLCVVLALPTGISAAETRKGGSMVQDVAEQVAKNVTKNVVKNVVSASEMRKADFIDIREDETVKGDLFAFAHRVKIEGTVDGDLYAFSEDVNVSGHVTGDIIGFAHGLRVSGRVDGNIRAFTNALTISGDVRRNVLTFNETTNLDPTGKIGGSLTLFAKSLYLDGHLGRSLLAFFEHADLGGQIAGAVRVKGDSLVIKSTAVIDGPIHFEGHKEAEVSPSAKLASQVEFKQLEHRHAYREGSYYIWQMIWAAAFVLFGLVLFALMPRFAGDAVKSAEQYGAAAGLGVLVMFGVPIAAIIACVTVVGLFIGVSTLFLWYASLYFAQIIVGAVVGQWLMGRTDELWPLIGRMAVGLVIVRLCTMIPHAGGWVKFAAILWGIGAISLAVYRRFQPVIAPGLPSAPTTPLPPSTTVGGPLPA